MTTSPKYGYTDLENNAGNVTAQSLINRVHEAMANMRVESDTLTAPPAHTEGNVYLVATGATGAWAGQDGNLAISISAGWTFVVPADGMVAWFTNTDQLKVYDGGTTTWVELVTSTATVTASTTQTQGQQPLTSRVNVATVVATANDVVTLPAAVRGRTCSVLNRGAFVLQVFPATGDAVEAYGTNTSFTVAVGEGATLWATSASQWYSLHGVSV